MRISSALLATTLGMFLSLGTSHADDEIELQKKSEKSEKSEESISDDAIKALEKSGVNPEMIKKIQESVKRGGGTSVSVSTTVVDSDGKVTTRTTHNGVPVEDAGNGVKTMTLNLEELLSEATKAAAKASAQAKATSGGDANSSQKSHQTSKTSTSTSISGKVVVVGEDGEVKTHTIGDDLGDGALEKALGEALRSIDIKTLDPEGLLNQAQVFGFGPATIEDGSVSKRLDEIEKELQEQRKLLEKILKKVDQ